MDIEDSDTCTDILRHRQPVNPRQEHDLFENNNFGYRLYCYVCKSLVSMTDSPDMPVDRYMNMYPDGASVARVEDNSSTEAMHYSSFLGRIDCAGTQIQIASRVRYLAATGYWFHRWDEHEGSWPEITPTEYRQVRPYFGKVPYMSRYARLLKAALAQTHTLKLKFLWTIDEFVEFSSSPLTCISFGMEAARRLQAKNTRTSFQQFLKQEPTLLPIHEIVIPQSDPDPEPISESLIYVPGAALFPIVANDANNRVIDLLSGWANHSISSWSEEGSPGWKVDTTSTIWGSVQGGWDKDK